MHNLKDVRKPSDEEKMLGNNKFHHTDVIRRFVFARKMCFAQKASNHRWCKLKYHRRRRCWSLLYPQAGVQFEEFYQFADKHNVTVVGGLQSCLAVIMSTC